MKEKTIDKIAKTRIIYLILCFISSVLGVIGLAILNNLLLDQLVCLIVIVVVFSIIITIAIMHSRKNNGFIDSDTSYSRLFLRIVYCWAIIVAAAFIPEFFVPVMLLPIILTTVCSDIVSLTISIFMTMCFCYISNASNYVIISYIILILISQIISSYMKKSDDTFRIDVLILLLCSNIVIPVVFYYFAYFELNWKIFIFGLVEGLLICLFFAFCFNYLITKSKKDNANKYSVILDENYCLVKDIKNFSMTEYNHAIKVSNLAKICALEINVNENTASCGGFYYRLGRMEGEPEIDNAVKTAINHCFPKDVINILSEYGGIISKPSTPESAIVHMVDVLVTKIELLDSDKMSSTWNQDMVIYQTLNEFSQAGFYDESGLSMNQFLKVREKLVNEDSFL